MSSKQIRAILKNFHLVAGISIALFIYVSALRNDPFFSGLLQFVIIPGAAITGITMSQLPRFNKWRNQRRQGAVKEA